MISELRLQEASIKINKKRLQEAIVPKTGEKQLGPRSSTGLISSHNMGCNILGHLCP